MVKDGACAAYLTNVTIWLNQQVSGVAGDLSAARLKELVADPLFRRALDQRQLISITGADELASFVRGDPTRAAFLAWLLENTTALDLLLEGAVPVGITAREQDRYALPATALEIWSRISQADPDAREGLCLRLAIATALRPPGTGNHGAGQAIPPADPLDRYRHFKAAHQKGELFPSFAHLTVWELQHVVSSCASDRDLAWAREMINTWRPDLRDREQVVNSTSEVWRRNSPHPYTNYPSVLSGGGKCGPRSSWAVMVCQAFGIPAIGVGQPAHACVAYKAADPRCEPQPGSAWKVAYGRGWQVSRLEGLSGADFLAGVEARSRAAEFSLVEHLRWLSRALAAPERAAAVMAVAHAIQSSAPAAPTDLAASAKAEEAEREVSPTAHASPAPAPRDPLPVPVAGARTEAASFAGQSGLCVYDCFTGGQQVNFQKNLEGSWVEYTLDVPAAATFVLTLEAATPNDGQVLEVSAGADARATVQVPNTAGLWGKTPAVQIRLAGGRNTLRLSAPFQRGIALRSLELKVGGG